MGNTTLQTNLATFLFHLPEQGLVYIKQYGPGNLRIGTDRESLQGSVGQTIQEGIVQVTAGGINGWVQYFWKGDLWAISDQPGAVAWVLPGQAPFLNRGFGGRGAKLPNDPNLSTYKT